MSYILSALKKVERTRRTGAAPGLLSVQIEEAPTAGGWWRTSVVTVAVIAVAAAGVWQLRDWIAGVGGSLMQAQDAAAPAAAPPQAAAKAPAAPAPQAPPASGAQQGEAALPQAADYPPVDYDALTPQVRAQIPPFSISGFLYSATRPHANKVIINGVALRAGQYVNDELMLKEINSDNIVMDFRGSLIRIGSDRLSGY